MYLIVLRVVNYSVFLIFEFKSASKRLNLVFSLFTISHHFDLEF